MANHQSSVSPAQVYVCAGLGRNIINCEVFSVAFRLSALSSLFFGISFFRIIRVETAETVSESSAVSVSSAARVEISACFLQSRQATDDLREAKDRNSNSFLLYCTECPLFGDRIETAIPFYYIVPASLFLGDGIEITFSLSIWLISLPASLYGVFYVLADVGRNVDPVHVT